MTKQEAIKLAESKFYEKMSAFDIAKFQLHEDKLCMPFSVFHEAVEKALGRPVFTHEFGPGLERLQKELLGESPKPSPEDILNLIPKEKRIIVVGD